MYIKGMKIPKEGRITIQIGADGAVYTVTSCKITAEVYEKKCLAIEVPELHGRLIDADALLNKLQELYDERECEARYTGSKGTTVSWNDAVYQIVNAPTIVPASEKEEADGQGKWCFKPKTYFLEPVNRTYKFPENDLVNRFVPPDKSLYRNTQPNYCGAENIIPADEPREEES